MAERLSLERQRNLAINNVTMFKAQQVPCADCLNWWHPIVMTFDHVGRLNKYRNPSKLRTDHPDIFNAEVAKCEVVCTNCHAMREYLRDIGLVDFSPEKVNKYKYYQRLVPYLTNGALLNPQAYAMVPIGKF